MTGILVTGHRGVASLAPENTLAGINTAAALGVPQVEIDTQLTADGVAVVFHDTKLERCTDGHGELWQHSAASIAALDAGSHFSTSFAGEPVPRLDAALDLAAARGLSVNLEIKVARQDWCGQQVYTTLETATRSRLPGDRLLLSSFDITALAAAAREAPELRLGLICEQIPTELPELADSLGLATVHVQYEQLSIAGARHIHATGTGIHVWTLNDPSALPALRELGIEGVITDRPQDFTDLV